jgi:regulator of nonsense transcripts 3
MVYIMSQLQARTKVVVRRLPPALSEDAFRDSLAGWLERSNWFSYVPGKSRRAPYIFVHQPRGDHVRPTWRNHMLAIARPRRSSKRLVHSRAYINFADLADVLGFKAAHDGHAYVNERGAQFRQAPPPPGAARSTHPGRPAGLRDVRCADNQPAGLSSPPTPPLVRRCSVEYAPYQKVARQKVKRDPKEGTIDKGAPSSQRSRA